MSTQNPSVPPSQPPNDSGTGTLPDQRFVIHEHSDPFDVIRLMLEQAQSGDATLKILNGYQFVRPLGKGGMGAVALLRKEHDGDEIALKLMLPRVAVNQRSRERFLREIENTKALQHVHVVRLKEAGCWMVDFFFFTMEYCGGGSVAQLIVREGGKLKLDRAIPIILQVLDGLDYAHHAEIPHVELRDGSIVSGKGLVHRDVKPENIYLSEAVGGCIAKLGDYGLSKAFELAGLTGKTTAGEIGGTPCFMPQQQLEKFKYPTPDMDVWAVAATLYYMLTGCCPRDFRSGQGWLYVLSTTRPVSVRNRPVLAPLPRKLADVIDQALNDRDELHFKSASQFKHSLLKALAVSG
jgi:serine/threonine protein kinase